MKLYGRPNSLNVQKVLWFCDELELDYEHAPLGGSFGGTDEPWFLDINPNGLVPVLEDEGATIWESNTIMRYLAATHGAPRFWPEDPMARSRGERWMDWELGNLNPPLTTLFLGLIRTPVEKRDLKAIAAADEIMAKKWTIVEGELGKSEFLGGDDFGLAEVAVGIYAYRWIKLTSLPSPGPNFDRWYARLTERQAFESRAMLPMT